ncbi:MAG TPA: hypothetical protein DEG17_18165 [Cyanobacteria bacterium UBA11149]|nr:hypothetical protein [Cyanobacteria bacterium UBA11367]HBE59213.1 hypothetical protein [Cyanobacteria bacterium UBA11366]HBK63676.1 hypothetical protein [Cyanobacteria bacterium UBA11166]HBR72964.1 hypothetical protein [Cyanobacteria bacterium UBA11159]HBS69106.1 hypothetical protein [Cyanobacteria bacterium UBA11153]HBW90744.1 hypothetical protein [Cyanobacteria bacterium UBA11149]HCA97461.1 hypothetical protein [Cyanobacteria bacterium UBA9226]
MNRFFSVSIITLTILLTPGCSLIKSEHTSGSNEHITASTHDDSHAMTDRNINEGEKESDSVTTQAKLTIPPNIKSQTPVPLVIDIQDKEGKPIAKFQTFQEQLMHLIVVSEELDFFNHIHPTYKENGRFEVETNFPKSGNYTLFSDYQPAGGKERVSVLKAQIPGTNPSPAKIDLNLAKTFGDTKVSLTFSQPSLKVRQDVTLMFDLRDTATNQPITDLQPYLGERGHLVIIKQSSPLTKADYIHAHAVKDSPAGKVDFMTHFSRPGKYKVWGQFNRNGKIITADFWIDVI